MFRSTVLPFRRRSTLSGPFSRASIQLLDGKSDILLKSVGVLLRPGSYEVAFNDGRELDSYRYAISYADVR